MIPQLRHWWQESRASFWFVPTAIVIGAVFLATILIITDVSVDLHLDQKWPMAFGSGAAGSRGLLTTVAGSMITVAGVVFSITIVALSLTSSQYTSRVLRNFMRDPMNQVVLGVFVGIFAYCLVVLRTIRGGDEGAFVPSLAVLGGLVLAFVGIAFLIYFIHHISISIQAASIIAAAAEDSIAGLDHLFPQELGDDADDDRAGTPDMRLEEQSWFPIEAHATGYIESVNSDALLALAREHRTIVRMERGIGEFMVKGSPLISVTVLSDFNKDLKVPLQSVFVISRQRTLHQDAGFGIRQIVDIALKALSRGVNDTTTAVMCVDYLGAILVRLASRRIATPDRLEEGELRVIARGPCFESLLAEAFDQIRQNAEGNVAVLTRQLETLETIAGHAVNLRRREMLRRHGDLISVVAERSIPWAHDVAGVRTAAQRLAQTLDTPPRPREK